MTGDPAGIALILTPVSVVAVAVINVWNGRRVGQMHGDVKEGLRVGRQIDAAVNGKGPGEQTIAQDVKTVLDKQEVDMPSAPAGGAVLPQMAEIRAELVALRSDVAEIKAAR